MKNFAMLKFFLNETKYYNIRFYSMKFGRSLIGYKQMPDAFYNKKRKLLPPKIYTAISDAKISFSDKSIKYLMTFQYRYNVTFPKLFDEVHKYQLNSIKKAQIIPSESIDELGVDLCVAHLVIHMGGAILIEGSDQWIGFTKDRKNLLPNIRVRNFKIAGVDLSGSHIMYEGIEYFPSLTKLKELRLKTCAFLDDHCLRRISRMRNKLEYLDISDCPQISGKGLATLWNLKNLKVLNLANNPILEDKELVSLLLMEKIPQLQIKGVDYLAGLTIKQRENFLLLYSEQQKLITEKSELKQDSEATSDNQEDQSTEEPGDNKVKESGDV